MQLRASIPLCLALLCAAAPATADECADGPVECGRRAFASGVEAYKAARYPEAIEHFREALRLREHPVVEFNLGLARARNGQFVEALEHYERVLGDQRLPGDMRPTVEDERANARRRVSAVQLDVTGEGVVRARLGDRPLGGKPLQLRANPGTYRLVVTVDGRSVLDRRVQLSEGEKLRFGIDASGEPIEEVASGESDAGVGDAGPVETASGGADPVWFWLAAGGTAVLAGVSTWSALDTQSAFDDYERDLPELSQAEVNRRVDEGHGKERRTNILIGATAFVGVGTAVLGGWFTNWQGNTEVAVGPRGVALRGRF